MKKYICIHGHFYQPPRENPWINEIESEKTAFPYKNWNQRIANECYSPNTFARILNEEKKIVRILNNYSRMSHNIGPTLLQWLQKYEFETYQNIIEADMISREKFSGHGAAIAQAYNHIIMPLASLRDKKTQVKWGIADFIDRYERYPEGLWLPETAVDTETLEVLAEHEIKFTILAPHQAKSIRHLNASDWIEVASHGIDTTMAYLAKLPSGKTINLFFYNGGLSHAVSFGNLLRDGKAFADRLIQADFPAKRDYSLMHIAVDGETFGHHHRFGEMALAFCLNEIEKSNAQITVYAEFLEKHPPEYEVQINENTSWSCAHGIERWRDDCGCKTGLNPSWRQLWRKPLRESLNWLRDYVNKHFEKKAEEIFENVWRARNKYIHIVLSNHESKIEKFLSTELKNNKDPKIKTEALLLMELQYNLLMMFTSCAWFFDDITDIATQYVLRFAVRGIEIAEKLFEIEIYEKYKSLIHNARSNTNSNKTGAVIVEKQLLPDRVDPLLITIHFALSLLDKPVEEIETYNYTILHTEKKEYISEKALISTGKMKIVNNKILETSEIYYTIVQEKPYHIHCYASFYHEIQNIENFHESLEDIVKSENLVELIRFLNSRFRKQYLLQNLLKDFIQKYSYNKIEEAMNEILRGESRILVQNYRLLAFLAQNSLEIPHPLMLSLSNIYTKGISRLFEKKEIDIRRLKKYLNQAKFFSLSLHTSEIEFAASFQISEKMKRLLHQMKSIETEIKLLHEINETIEILNKAVFELDTWRVQNFYYKIYKRRYKIMSEKSSKGISAATEWLKVFNQLGENLHIHFL
ncbi:MAG: DUF3536 domain-containing protein [Spirochaetia bacterium]|nr:DUF3536 domain-containing protein [Spirochaetia bacterium]